MKEIIQLLTISEDHFLRLYRGEVRTIIIKHEGPALRPQHVFKVCTNGQEVNSFKCFAVWSKLIFTANNGVSHFQVGLSKC